MNTHLDAIAALGFVGRRLPVADPRNGTDFVPPTQFNDHPQLVVSVDEDGTEMNVFDGYVFVYQVRFTPDTPANVVNQAVAAAL